MDGLLVFIGIVVLAIFGGLFGVDSRDGAADWPRSLPHPHNR
jgi:hypothetical protein